jgi:gamma-glutamyltranspeptidase/glutathione hydrolase
MILDAIGPDADPLDPRSAPEVATAYAAATDFRATRLGDPGGDTVAIVAADWEGRAVSLIQSLFASFGAGILDPATGIIAHNRGSYFSLDEDSPNVLAPGKRPVHTLTPVLVDDAGGHLHAVLGTMGGAAQPQILTQLIQRVRRGATATEAMRAPRWVVVEGTVLAEPGVPQAALDELANAGWPSLVTDPANPATGESQLIIRLDELAYQVASDPRCEGASHP